MDDSAPPVAIRPAAPDDSLDVRRILDAAMLEFAPLEARIDAEDVLVATDADAVAERPVNGVESIRGAIVLEPEPSVTVTEGIETAGSQSDGDGSKSRRDAGAHVDAIAVRKRHRDRGIGSALIERALEREGRLTAHFDAGVRPFYEAHGFDIVPIDDERYGGACDRNSPS